MTNQRSSGILLHPTSLPGPFGIGDLGPKAYQWVDFLDHAGVGLWEVLPLGPTGYGNSPYQCFSAFAGSPYLISPELLVKDGLLSLSDLIRHPSFPKKMVDFYRVSVWKDKLFNSAYKNFQKQSIKFNVEFGEFQTKQSFWLPDYATYMAIKETLNNIAWSQWPDGFQHRKNKFINEFISNNKERILYYKFLQFIFFRQWQSLYEYAHKKNISIIGDIPLFIAYDSADVWAKPELFDLTNDLQPRVIAGVPPDYFSPTGQLWGNPHYQWSVHKKHKYDWWIERFKITMRMVDIVRLDHFRGFCGYWEVPAGNSTAEQGRWVKGPGIHFFSSLEKSLGKIPIIAEDLGIITPDVEQLRDYFNFPGMRILQFSFGSDASDPFLPHNYPVNCVAYTGTHDNATARGWYLSASEKERRICRKYLNSSGRHISWDMINAVWSSVSKFAIAPMQDFLELSNQARMNFPGKMENNWKWRMMDNCLTNQLKKKIKAMNSVYGRDKDQKPADKNSPIIRYEDR